MPAGYQDLYLEQGTTFNTTLNLTDNAGAAYNLYGFSVYSQAKKSYISTTPTITFTATIQDASNGIIALNATNTVTANVSYGKLVYDVVIVDTFGNRTRVLEGKIIVSPGVTIV